MSKTDRLVQLVGEEVNVGAVSLRYMRYAVVLTVSHVSFMMVLAGQLGKYNQSPLICSVRL